LSAMTSPASVSAAARWKPVSIMVAALLGLATLLGRQLGRSGDLAYHATMLIELLFTLGVLLTPQTRGALSQFGSRD
jgi:hypothetical protein